MTSNLILIGMISSAYHLKGLVKISSYTGKPEDICLHACFDKQGNEYKMKFIKHDKKKIIAKIEGIHNRTEAEKILGTKLYADRSNFPEIEKDEHYITDLIGRDVIDQTGTKIGKVKAFHNFGAGDIIEISFKDKKSELFPFTKALFPELQDEFVRMDQ